MEMVRDEMRERTESSKWDERKRCIMALNLRSECDSMTLSCISFTKAFVVRPNHVHGVFKHNNPSRVFQP